MKAGPRRDRGSCRVVEDPAHALGSALGGVDLARVLPEADEVAPKGTKILEPLVHVGDLVVDQFRDMPARRLALVPDVENLAQLAKGQPDGLARPDELEAVDHTRVVVAVSGGCPLRLGEEALLLIEAYGRRGQTHATSDFTDLHKSRLALDLQLYLKVYVHDMVRKVALQYFEGCPNWRTTADHLARLAGEGLDVTVDHEIIDSHETAVARDFHGSPTVLVDGVDPFADENTPIGLACRIYRTPQGIAGSPTLSQLRQALTADRGE